MSVVSVLAAALDQELSERFNFWMQRQTSEEIISAVIARAATAAHAYESSHPVRAAGRAPGGGRISWGDASAVDFSQDQQQSPSSAALAPARTAGGGRDPSGDAPAVTLVQLWEYRVIALAADQIGASQDHLNDVGREGWEIAAVVPAGIDHTLYLKRPLAEKAGA